MNIICHCPLTFTRTLLDAQQNIEALKDATLGCTAPRKLLWSVPETFILQTLWQLGVAFPARPGRKKKITIWIIAKFSGIKSYNRG